MPAGAEQGVQLYYYPEGGADWQALPTVLSVEESTAAARPRGPGLYVLLASTPLRLRQGWNPIFAYPGASGPLPAALAGAAGRYQLVYGYDGTDKRDPWKLHAPGLAAPWGAVVNDLTELRQGASYWIRASEVVTASVHPQAKPLAGLAQACMLAMPPATYYGLAPISSSRPLTVEALVGPGHGVHCGEAITKSLSLDGQPRQASSLNVLAYGAGAEGCGALGAAVRLVFHDGGREVGRLETVWENSRLIGLNLHRLHLPVLGARAPVIGVR